MIRNILVPLDGSDLAAQALPHARALSRLFDAAVTLVRVVPQSGGQPIQDAAAAAALGRAQPVFVPDGGYGAPLSDGAPFEAREKAAAEAYLDSLSGELALTGLKTAVMTIAGRPAEAILAAAAERNADLIIMSTHGRGGVRRFLLGSVATHVIGLSSLPIVLVRGAGLPGEAAHTRAAEYRRILVPLDGSALAAGVLPLVADLAARSGATAQLMRVMPEPREDALATEGIRVLHSITGGPTTAGVAVDPYGAQIEREREGAQSSLDGAQAELRQAGAACETRVEFGPAAEKILDVASATETDLIAMATHGRTGLARFLMGSVADRVVRHSHAPVLLVRTLPHQT